MIVFWTLLIVLVYKNETLMACVRLVATQTGVKFVYARCKTADEDRATDSSRTLQFQGKFSKNISDRFGELRVTCWYLYLFVKNLKKSLKQLAKIKYKTFHFNHLRTEIFMDLARPFLALFQKPKIVGKSQSEKINYFN